MAEPQEQAENRVNNPALRGLHTRWQPGQSGNPGGRPKDRSLTKLLNELADRTEFDGQTLPDGKTLLDMIAEEFYKRALKGDFRFANAILERRDGKVIQVIEQQLKAYIDASPESL